MVEEAERLRDSTVRIVGGVRSTAAQSRAVRRSILREAFAGRLVPQVAGSNLNEKVGA